MMILVCGSNMVRFCLIFNVVCSGIVFGILFIRKRKYFIMGKLDIYISLCMCVDERFSVIQNDVYVVGRIVVNGF